MPDIDSDFFSSGYIFFRPDVNAFVPVALQTQYGSGKERCSALTEWFDEFAGYHRKDGLIVKTNDDLLSATRIGIMAIRHARPTPLGSRQAPRQGSVKAKGMDFDVFTGEA